MYLIQTHLSVGYAPAARLIQAMDDKGLIGPAKGSTPREVINLPQAENEHND